MSRIRFKRGDTFSLSATYTEDGSPVDLSGFSIQMQVRDGGPGGDVLADVDTAGGGIVITDAVNGEYSVTVADTVTDDWPVGRAVLDIEYVTGAGEVRSTETVEVEVLPDVTRG